MPCTANPEADGDAKLLLPILAAAERSRPGLLGLYDFRDTDGDVVKDVSGAGSLVVECSP